MRAFENIVIGWVHQMLVQTALGFCFKLLKIPQEQVLIADLKAILGMLILRMRENFAILNAICPLNLIDRVHFLDIRSQTLQTISHLSSHRLSWQTSDLLEVGELSNFHTIQPNFPAQTS